ncbi:MAG: NifB/NifX family molybdenum-iron cluster-binding protein [Deltaproteobacteria bacterium]|nr:NifB/NifX family molybdenum-iron cluster-binding protein [Deltaproteobacteria bacterium]
MLIAITATGNNLQSEIDPRFGRAAYYMIVNTETGEVTAHDNSDGINASNGAGTGAAQTLSEYGVEAVYTGRVGPKAADVLNQAKIPYYENISGTVEDVLNQLELGDDKIAPAQPVAEESSVSAAQCQGAVTGAGRGLGMGAGRGQGRGMGRGGGRGQGMGTGQGRGACFTAQAGTGQGNPPAAATGGKPKAQSKFRLTK